MRAAAAMALLACGCTAPEFGDGHLACAAINHACPDGFYCATDLHCWRNGSGPSAFDLAGADFAGVDFSGADFSSVDFSGADFSSVDLARDLSMTSGDLASNPSRCSLGTYKLCDGFEGASIDATKWQVFMQNGTVSIDTTFAFRGNQSIKFHHDVTPASGGQAETSIANTTILPITTTIYARAWFFMPAPAQPAVANLINFVDQSAGQGASFVDDHGHPGLNDYTPPLAYAASAAQTVATGTWTCLEMAMPQTGTTGTLNIWMNDTPVDVSLTGAQTLPISQLVFGVYYYQPPMLAAEDIWLDEVIVDDKPVSCAD
jgi:hypothetical protein